MEKRWTQGRRMAALLGLTWVAGGGLGACASRTRQVAPPPTSAASAAAPEAPAAAVGVALGEEPPLPGEPTGDWQGLAEPRPTTEGSPHAH
ncbi:MAG TPA: hypothetical protein VFZ09_32635 [Archangium sp.]|uniref:hypothetical protein n=1 Tax=Archangium sp. TaxID=1872627 RepID=UPI002E340445|nr:hypothetical protein [Archangium sp.]HEX5751019.1 hypothetical protein [Archangium sp.]